MLTVMKEDQSLDEVNATFKSKDSEEEYHVPLESKDKNHEDDHEETVTTHELPAPYGCRSVATKTCRNVPMTVAKKEPYEKCKEVKKDPILCLLTKYILQVPSVDCGMVLKKVPELLCVPEIYDDCKDLAVQVPYIDTG